MFPTLCPNEEMPPLVLRPTKVAGRDRGRPPGSRRIVGEELYSIFCAIEKVLNTLHQKKRIPDWETVKECTIRSCGLNLLLSDINTILEIYPEAYILNWRTLDADKNLFELCIKLPHCFLGKLETRSSIFR